MKKILLTISIAFVLVSCATIRRSDGCPSKDYRNIQKHDAKPFRAEIKSIKPIGNDSWYVRAWRYGHWYEVIYEGCGLPDSIKKGATIDVSTWTRKS